MMNVTPIRDRQHAGGDDRSADAQIAISEYMESLRVGNLMRVWDACLLPYSGVSVTKMGNLILPRNLVVDLLPLPGIVSYRQPTRPPVVLIVQSPVDRLVTFAKLPSSHSSFAEYHRFER